MPFLRPFEEAETGVKSDTEFKVQKDVEEAMKEEREEMKEKENLRKSRGRGTK